MASVIDKDDEMTAIQAVEAAAAEGASQPDPPGARTVQRTGTVFGGARFQEVLRAFSNARGFDALLSRLQQGAGIRVEGEPLAAFTAAAAPRVVETVPVAAAVAASDAAPAAEATATAAAAVTPDHSARFMRWHEEVRAAAAASATPGPAAPWPLPLPQLVPVLEVLATGAAYYSAAFAWDVGVGALDSAMRLLLVCATDSDLRHTTVDTVGTGVGVSPPAVVLWRPMTRRSPPPCRPRASAAH